MEARRETFLWTIQFTLRMLLDTHAYMHIYIYIYIFIPVLKNNEPQEMAGY